jgi:hypothetical protein
MALMKALHLEPGSAIYNKLKLSQFHFIVCGHIHQSDGEARRSDVYNGNTVHTLLIRLPGQNGGGNGLLRIYEFDPSANKLSAKTFLLTPKHLKLMLTVNLTWT